MNHPKFASICALTMVVALAGCATSAPTSTAAGAAPAAITVPSLKIVADCAPCQIRPAVPVLMVSGYNDAAAKAGARVSPDSVATVTVIGYSERSDTARLLVGAFAGKDEIRTAVQHQDKKFEVEDYYRNAWQGIDSLAKAVGEQIFAKIKP